jgi:tetratricopeptide (TPR) repeat protein
MSKRFAICALLVVTTVVVFAPVAHHDFVNYDDPTYVTSNPHVRSGLSWENGAWAFTSRYGNNWHPLTWLSHMLDCELFGLNPGAHHLMNLAIHALNVVLLFLLLHRITFALWPSVFVAALFALHPLHVESVAWIAERKDVLSTLFGLLTMWTYARHVENRSWWQYAIALLLFALGLMSKPMLVTLPCVLLLLDYWPLGRIKLDGVGVLRQFARLGLEKIPFFILSAVSCSVTIWAQNVGGTVISTEGLPVSYRLTNALVSYARYLSKTFWPKNMAVFYPHPGEWGVWTISAASGLVVVMSLLALRYARHMPYLIVGWLWFLGTLVPVIGLVQVGGQSLADRYTYIPLIGIFLCVAWACRDLIENRPGARKAVIAVGVIVICGCAFLASTQLRHWRNSFTLFEHALRVTRDNHVAHNNLGIALAEKGRVDEAIVHFQEQVRLRPNFASAHNNLGLALAARGRPTEAAAHFAHAVEINPGFAEAHNNLGCALASLGKVEEAASHFTRAVEIKPEFVDANFNLACALQDSRRIEDAVTQYRRVLELQPNHSQATRKLAWILATHPDASVRNATDAARLAERLQGFRSIPKWEALDILAAAYAEAGRFDEAVKAAEMALESAETEPTKHQIGEIRTRLELYRGGRPYHNATLPYSH